MKTEAPTATGTLIINFGPENILDLLCHYSEGAVPLGCKLLQAGFSDKLGRHIGLLVESDQWDMDEVLRPSDALDPKNAGALPQMYVRYEGKKVFSWGNKHTPTKSAWRDSDNFQDH